MMNGRPNKTPARILVYFASFGLSAALQAVPALLSLLLPDLDNAAIFIHAFFLYLAHPVCAAIFPFLLTRKYHCPSISCFFHFGLFLLFLPFYPDGKPVGVLCLVIGVFSAAVGETLNQSQNRKNRPPHSSSGGEHRK